MRNSVIAAGLLVMFGGVVYLIIQRDLLANPESVSARLEKSRILLSHETDAALQRAAEELASIAGSSPKSKEGLEARFLLGQTYERLNQMETALEFYQKLQLEDISKDLMDRLDYRIGRIQLEREYIDEGLNRMFSLLARNGDPLLRSKVYVELGRHHFRRKEWQRAEQNLRIAVGENSRNYEGKELLADTLEKQGKKIEARAMRQGIQHDIKLGQKASNQRKTQPVATPGDRDRLLYVMRKGRENYIKGNLAESSRFYSIAAREYSTTKEADDALYYMGELAMKRKDWTSAVKHFNVAISNKPRNRDEQAYLKKGEAYFSRGDYGRAAKVFSSYLKLFKKGVYRDKAVAWEAESKQAMASQIPSGNTSLRPVNNGGTKPQTTTQGNTQTGTNKPAGDHGHQTGHSGSNQGPSSNQIQSGSMALPTDDHHAIEEPNLDNINPIREDHALIEPRIETEELGP